MPQKIIKPSAYDEYIEAKEHCDRWKEAEFAVINGQSYQIGTKRLDRANLYQIREQIKFWESRMEKAYARYKGKSFKRRVTRITPID